MGSTHGCRLLFSMVWVAIAIQMGFGKSEQAVEIIVAARCTVRCLSSLQSRSLSTGRQNTEPVSLERCQSDSVCSECSRPCTQPFSSVKECEEWCASQAKGSAETDCAESCRFLRQVNTIRPGTCPPETQATGFAAVCKNICESDADCDASLKCCSNACGWTCQVPTHVQEGMPDIPLVPTISSSVDSAVLHWLPVGLNTTGDVLYLVDSRMSVGRQIQNYGKSSWKQIEQTTSTTTVLQGLRPGHWYQFRVSAVNIYGSRGPSAPTQPFILDKNPDKPGPPTNLTLGDSIITDNKVAVTILWSPPANSDLPVGRYKIYWSKRLKIASPQFHSMQEYRQVLSGNHHSYRITDLEPDTTYFVQVQAISQHGDVRLKSEKASLHIQTYPLPRSSNRVSLSTPVPSITVRPMPTPPVPDQLTVIETYYQNGLLKANLSWNFEEAGGRDERPDKLLVYWSTEGCSSDLTLEEPPVMSATTHVNFFTIYDLRFSCRYLIRVQAVTIHGVTGTMAYAFLDTPLCGQALVIGEVQPDCPRTSVRLPGEPTNVQYKFIISSSNISVRLSWGHPLPGSSPPITGFRIVWGPVQSGVHFLLLDPTTANQRDVQKDIQVLVLSNLLESSTYAVCVQAITRTGRGRVMSLRFTTPVLRPLVAEPPYVDVGKGRVDSVRHNSIKKKLNSVATEVTTSYPPVIYTARSYSQPVKQVQTPSSTSLSSSSSFAFSLSMSDVFLQSCLLLLLQRLL